jgi:hypothetical protein
MPHAWPWLIAAVHRPGRLLAPHRVRIFAATVGFGHTGGYRLRQEPGVRCAAAALGATTRTHPRNRGRHGRAARCGACLPRARTAGRASRPPGRRPGGPRPEGSGRGSASGCPQQSTGRCNASMSPRPKAAKASRTRAGRCPPLRASRKMPGQQRAHGVAKRPLLVSQLHGDSQLRGRSQVHSDCPSAVRACMITARCSDWLPHAGTSARTFVSHRPRSCSRV